jgi:hypothetical protein
VTGGSAAIRTAINHHTAHKPLRGLVEGTYAVSAAPRPVTFSPPPAHLRRLTCQRANERPTRPRLRLPGPSREYSANRHAARKWLTQQQNAARPSGASPPTFLRPSWWGPALHRVREKTPPSYESGGKSGTYRPPDGARAGSPEPGPETDPRMRSAGSGPSSGAERRTDERAGQGEQRRTATATNGDGQPLRTGISPTQPLSLRPVPERPPPPALRIR